MDLRRVGLATDTAALTDAQQTQYLNLKLALLGLPTVGTGDDEAVSALAAALLARSRETDRLLEGYLCPADQRIQTYLNAVLDDDGPRLPERTFVLDRYGLARALSLPYGGDTFTSPIVSSYRLAQGVLHNPRSDRRTTEGIFHVTEDGLPIPDDKKAVPVPVFRALLARALAPPAELLRLPFTAGSPRSAETFVSLLLRPLVSPEVPGVRQERTLEVRFFAPGSLVGNLDFVESIFGNAGDPFLPENDAALDTDHWSGHTGCVILAPHLAGSVTKQSVGLPPIAHATERQKRDGMCWESPDELYNAGGAFKVTCRDERGVIVTIIADNYFGYCKKEVKTQISYAANLSLQSEEEHAGGALVFPSYDLGEEFSGETHVPRTDYTFADVLERYGPALTVHPDGYATDARYPEIVYVPETVHMDVLHQRAWWTAADGSERSLKLLPNLIYIRPSGYKIHLERVGRGTWRLVGTLAEGTFCHKPCTVSGGGKSEISKPLTDAVLQGPVFVADFAKDFDAVEQIVHRDFGDRFARGARADSRPLLDPSRSLGSVIKLLTPASRDYTEAYNDWVKSVPQTIKELVFTVKRFYRPEWGDDWRAHFSVDIVNGTPANELRCDGRKIIAHFLRVGYEADGSWRTFGLRKDFHPAAKIQTEDDITASVVVPASALTGLNPDRPAEYVKFAQNCEYRLFQRPDDAIHRGYDKQTEADFAQPGNFLSNYEPLTPATARALLDDSIGFDLYTPPLQALIRTAAAAPETTFFAAPSHPRLVDGTPSKNPRYLQVRPDLVRPRETYLAALGARMHRKLPLGAPVPTPVDAVLPGRRNNPPEPGARPLCVFNPIHWLDTPELFMEFISSMTGKSPSTTGAGSEGALTKGPFNALLPIHDLNAAYVSHLLTGAQGFVTAAGWVGPHFRVDHDVSLLVPELWCRMSETERDPAFLCAEGYLEKCEDLEVAGRKVLTSRLGWRITRRFVRAFFGRIFSHPQEVFPEEMLRPEKQDQAIIVTSMDTMVETQRRVASQYFADGAIEAACPPLRVLLHLMRDDHYEGLTLADTALRAHFTREALLKSDWYHARVDRRHAIERALWQRHLDALEAFLARPHYADEATRLGIVEKLERAQRTLDALEAAKDGAL
jgi:hypothetical protein